MIRLGQKLREERIKKGFTLDDVAKATKIRASFLSALEKGEYQSLPSSAYAQGFVKNYAAFLGLSSKATAALFRREFDEKRVYKVLPESFAKNEEFPTKRLPFKTVFWGTIFFFILVGYILFQYKYAIINPPLTIESPKENQIITKTDISVSGQTDENVTLYINNVAVPVDQNGDFKKTVSVFPGKQKITIKAVSRFGRETIIQRHIEVYAP